MPMKMATITATTTYIFPVLRIKSVSVPGALSARKAAKRRENVMVPFFILHQFFWGLKSFYFSTSPNIIWLFALKKRKLNRHYEYQLYKRIDDAIFCPIKSLIQTVPVLTTSVSSVWGEERRPTALRHLLGLNLFAVGVSQASEERAKKGKSIPI